MLKHTQRLTALICNSWQKLKSRSISPRDLSFYLFPGYCILCGVHSGRPLDLCQPCEEDLPVNLTCCQHCAVPLSAYQLCGACITNSPPFEGCIAPLRYEFPVNKLISSFKYSGQLSRGAVLAHLLLQQISKKYQTISQPFEVSQPHITNQLGLPDLITPVPLHWQRQFVRGFNQSQWLAKLLGNRLNIDVDNRLLTRQKYTPPQQGLTRNQRKKNLKGAFRINHRVDGKHIVLVDDVVTTGSTVSELSLLLKTAGAARVEIWCLARTPLEK